METLKPQRRTKDEIEHFIFSWHEFPLDYWWRKKYNIPFGSRQHREMNFIDMLVEYREDLLLKELSKKEEEREEADFDRQFGLDKGSSKEVVHMTQEEIDEDYDNLDLSQFDKK